MSAKILSSNVELWLGALDKRFLKCTYQVSGSTGFELLDLPVDSRFFNSSTNFQYSSGSYCAWSQVF